jgi:hypothetical protein
MDWNLALDRKDSVMDYKQYPPPPDFYSDDCTVPWWLKSLFIKFRKACRWHDWARRHLVHYGIFTVKEADWQFRLYMKELSSWWNYWLIGPSWTVVKWTRKHYSATAPVRPSWTSYLQSRNP